MDKKTIYTILVTAAVSILITFVVTNKYDEVQYQRTFKTQEQTIVSLQSTIVTLKSTISKMEETITKKYDPNTGKLIEEKHEKKQTNIDKSKESKEDKKIIDNKKETEKNTNKISKTYSKNLLLGGLGLDTKVNTVYNVGYVRSFGGFINAGSIIQISPDSNSSASIVIGISF